METSHFWNERYSKDIGFEVLKTEKPSEAVVKLAKYLESKKIPFQGKVLDIGCGMGRNANWLAQKGFSVSGVDISQVAVKEASQRAQKLGLSINYQTADVSKSLPFADTSFDFVIDIVTNQLLSLDDLKSYKEEILRILEPEGKFLLYTLDRSVDKGAQQLLKDFPGPEENTYIIRLDLLHLVQPEKLKPTSGGFFPFENTSIIDLSRYQISKINEPLIDENENCLIYSMKQTKFFSEDILKDTYHIDLSKKIINKILNEYKVKE